MIRGLDFPFLQIASPVGGSFSRVDCGLGIDLKRARSWRRVSKRTPLRKYGSEIAGVRPLGVMGSFKETTEQQPQSENPDDISSLSHIMEPIREGETDVLLVYCPGALLAAERYFPLMHEVQAQLSLRLWVVVLHNKDHESLSTAKIESSLTGVILRLKERGFRPGSIEIENVFIAGHSIGAWLARSVALRKAQGFIQMGSIFDYKSDNLAQHPKPVLTVGGGLDGQMTPAVIAQEAGKIVATESDLGKFNTYGTKPVVIIPGMNHGQFCDGHVNTERGDLPADISLVEAHHCVAELVSAFLAVHVEGPYGEVAGARGLEILTVAVEETHRRYRPLWEALSNQAGGAVSHQVYIASPSSLSTKDVTPIHHDFVDNFVVSKPWIDKEKMKVYVTTYLSQAGKQGLCNLWVKMKRRETVLSQFGQDAANLENNDPGALDTQGKQINIKTFETALTLVSDDERDKFLAKGKKLRFVDDYLVPGPATIWIESDLSFRPVAAGKEIEVKVPVLMSPVNFSPRFAGMHYMKVLTLARAIHWILVDSFR